MSDAVAGDDWISEADEGLLEMFVNLLDNPDALPKAARAFRSAYTGRLELLLERIDEKHRSTVKALAQKLGWTALSVALLLERLEEGVSARSLKAVLQTTGELQELLGPSLPQGQPTRAGLVMREYRCPDLNKLPDFEAMKPVRQSTAKQVSYKPNASRICSDGAVFTGLLRIRAAGEYTLKVESLDGSRLWLDGQVLVENDGRRQGQHPGGWPHIPHLAPVQAEEREGKRALSAGYHELRLEWFAHHHWEHAQAPQLVLRYEGPDSTGANKEVPAIALCHGELPVQRIGQKASQFLLEKLGVGDNEDLVLPALLFYAGSAAQLLEDVPRCMRVRVACCMMRFPDRFAKSCGMVGEELPKSISEEVDGAVLEAFVEVGQQLAMNGEALQQLVRVLHSLCGQPPAVIAGGVRTSIDSPEQVSKFAEALKMAAGSVGWKELERALTILRLADAFETDPVGPLRDVPGLSPLAYLLAGYMRDGTVDISSLTDEETELIWAAFLLCPKAKRLFLPEHSACLVDTAKKLLPSLQVAHLGTHLTAQQLADLEEEYAATRELWVPALPSQPALREMFALFPTPTVVALQGSLSVPSSAALSNAGEVESPVFEMGDSVPEFTCVFEFRLQKHQVPGEVYQVCVGQWGQGHGDFVVGWSRHWANGQDNIIFQYEGNQGGGGRIMHGGKCCGFQKSGDLNDGEWHRVALLYDANNKTCTLYADGLDNPETQTWNHCNPLRLSKVTIGEQGGFTREGRRPDRRFPPGQLRNVELFESLVPPAQLFDRTGLEPPEIGRLRQELPGVQVIAQSIVPVSSLRKILQRYREDHTVDLSECEGLTKRGLALLMDFFPEVEKIFTAGCGCTPDLRILPAPGAAGDGKARWSGRMLRHCRKRNEPEWKDLAAIFLTRRMTKVIGGVADFARCGDAEVDEIMDLVLQLSNLGIDGSEGADRERAGLFLVRQALADPESVRLGLLDAAAYLHRDPRSYLAALPAQQRALLARLIVSSGDCLGMQPKHPPTKQSKECTPVDVALLEAFKSVVEKSSGSEELKRPLRHLRGLFFGPLVEVVESFHSVTEEDQWGAVRDAAQSIDWGGLREAFSMALLQPRTLKLKVKRRQVVTEEVVEAYEAPKSADAEDPLLCVVCAAEPEYRLSTDCPHYFCSTCARRSLEAIKDAGQFPAYCPGCRAHSALEGLAEPAVGRVQTPALALLERRGVITWDFQLQFLRQHTKDPEEYFQCPGKCGELLVACAPQFMAVAKGEHEHEGFRRMLRLGECPCGARMCVKCREVVKTDHRGRHEHACPPEKTVQDPHEEESVKTMERLGRRCPNCGIFLEMNGGCDIMMCGTEAHGRLEKALANGGCGYQFHWASGEPAHSFYIGLNGERVEGIVGTRG